MEDAYGILKIISEKEITDEFEAIERGEQKDFSSFFKTLKFYNNLFYVKNYSSFNAWGIENPYDVINERICQLNFELL